MKIKRNWVAFLLITICAISQRSFACTDFVIKSEDNAYIVGRSLEFAEFLPTRVKICPRGEKVESTAPNNQKGIKWTSKYAYVGMAAFDQDLFIDGFNENGLSVGILWFPDGKYPENNSNSPNTTLAFTDSIRWVLGNFANVEEVKAALPQVTLYTFPIPELGNGPAPGVHFSIHDTKGKSLVVEFLNGKLHLFDNPIGVLTNSPEFPWHLTNLRNYINLSAINANNVSFDGSVLQATGQGTGLQGIPGDWTPPSRFVRTALFKQFVKTPTNAERAVTAALHLLNTVDIPFGVVRGNAHGDFDYTQWIVIKDLTNGKLFVRTYGDQNIQTIALNNGKISEGNQPSYVNLNAQPMQ